MINTLHLGDLFGVVRPKQGYNLSQVLIGIIQTGVVGGGIAYAIWRGMRPNNLRADAGGWMICRPML